MVSETPINKAADNTESNARNVSNPVVQFGSAVKGRLDEFNRAAEGARPHENGKQSKAASSGKGERERGKHDEVHHFVAAVRCWWRCVQGPKHRDRQSEGYYEGNRNVEVLTH